MQIIEHTIPRMVISEEGKMLRARTDVYTPETTDENGNIIPEHKPSYSSIFFVPDSVTKDNYEDLYVEEKIEEK